MQGNIDKARVECEAAIRLDPEFGNPYNDIGVYLMQKNRLDEAIPWLEKAKLAKRYEPRHFPYLNLGRIYALKGMLVKALEEFQGALRFQPEDEMATQAIRQIQARLN
jgi:Tfp pilus assembly protein PilF